jgi:CheY-like chemotaxis protein
MSVSGLTDYDPIMCSIVLVDDSEDSLLVVQLLRDDCYATAHAGNYADAVALLQQSEPRLIILNLSMCRGEEMLQQIRACCGSSRLVVYSSTSNYAQLGNSGVPHLIVLTPADTPQFAAEIRDHAAAAGVFRMGLAAAGDDLHDAPPFTLRISSTSGETTHWLVYERIQFQGEEMHLTLACRYHLPFECGEVVTLRTRLGNAQATIGRLTNLGTLVLRLHQTSRISDLFEPSWD